MVLVAVAASGPAAAAEAAADHASAVNPAGELQSSREGCD
jgi:hypothetical protein